ncbi:ATPase, V1 complex, subunit C [Kipferlia bialata]|uniref:V-type proton ATPase subunit C n=1 Tax=Kipferlia bialata TaxID=797122 RepID=A0A9K3GJT5_9EUKA|nr:ATPase, V1 complex, subunit C [Kipferlia bialata]|eukprot:g7153.t1
MNHFWALAYPRDQAGTSTRAAALSKSPLLDAHEVTVPALSHGALDELLSLADRLSSLDTQAGTLAHKLEAQLFELHPARFEPMIADKTVSQYASKFQWNEDSFPTTESVGYQCQRVVSELGSVDSDFKAVQGEYTTVRTQLANKRRQESGTLATKSLHGMLDQAWFESDFMTTVLILLPKYQSKEFLEAYESWTDHVMPQSATLVAEDDQLCLYACVVMKGEASAFKDKARENRYTIREHDPEAESIRPDAEIQTLTNRLTQLTADMLSFLQANYGRTVACWVHTVMLRTYVEALLRFGLQTATTYCLVSIKDAGKMKAARAHLVESFEDLFSSGIHSTAREGVEATNFQLYSTTVEEDETYFPFVFHPVMLSSVSKQQRQAAEAQSRKTGRQDA